MINSMTGYGEADGTLDGVVYSFEIKTVNNRYLKTMIKLPEALSFLDADIEKLLRQKLSRGTVNCIVRLKNTTAESLFSINQEALCAATEQLSKIADSVGNARFDISSLLSLPGIVVPSQPDEDTASKIRLKVTEIAKKALDKLKQMRQSEGAALADDLKGHCSSIRELLDEISSRVEVVLDGYHKKLRKRVDELLSETNLSLDQETLARELAVFAERSDISEEIARLSFHLEQFVGCCQGNEPAGRKLDFISQEMLREANTIASKANDSQTSKCVVDIKCNIDRIKEQVQNVE
ncbi:MAG: YicC/YloC family endoribonuclease [Planctomycetota bacterium]